MSKWTAKLTVVNRTHQDLKLEGMYVYKGNSVKSFPNRIPAKKEGVYEVYTPSGKPLGPEFRITLVAQGNDSENSLGSFDFHVDIPYWSKKNTLEYHCNRDLVCRVSPTEIGDEQHNYRGEAEIIAHPKRTQKNDKVVSEAVVEQTF